MRTPLAPMPPRSTKVRVVRRETSRPHHWRSGSGTKEAPRFEELQAPEKDHGWIVTVFNNDKNTYEEVMTILILATGCDAEEAYMETWEIDHLGKSVVHQGSEEACLAVADIIATIGIKVEATKVE